MSHYDIDYAGMSYLDARAKALQDCRDWLGALPDGTDSVSALIEDCRKELPVPKNVWRLHMSLVGIQGYPVWVLYDECWPFG